MENLKLTRMVEVDDGEQLSFAIFSRQLKSLTEISPVLKEVHNPILPVNQNPHNRVDLKLNFEIFAQLRFLRRRIKRVTIFILFIIDIILTPSTPRQHITGIEVQAPNRRLPGQLLRGIEIDLTKPDLNLRISPGAFRDPELNVRMFVLRPDGIIQNYPAVWVLFGFFKH